MFGQKKHLHLKYLAGFYPYQTSFTRNKSTRYFLFWRSLRNRIYHPFSHGYTFCISIIPPPFLAVVKKRLRPFTLLPLPFFLFFFLSSPFRIENYHLWTFYYSLIASQRLFSLKNLLFKLAWFTDFSIWSRIRLLTVIEMLSLAATVLLAFSLAAEGESVTSVTSLTGDLDLVIKNMWYER